MLWRNYSPTNIAIYDIEPSVVNDCCCQFGSRGVVLSRTSPACKVSMQISLLPPLPMREISVPLMYACYSTVIVYLIPKLEFESPCELKVFVLSPVTLMMNQAI